MQNVPHCLIPMLLQNIPEGTCISHLPWLLPLQHAGEIFPPLQAVPCPIASPVPSLPQVLLPSCPADADTASLSCGCCSLWSTCCMHTGCRMHQGALIRMAASVLAWGGSWPQDIVFHALPASVLKAGPGFCFQSVLLLYGTYLAGLTDSVSSPPVNQSLTLIVGVNLIFLVAGTVVLIHRFFRAWHNLLFGFTSGGIFVCTTTINCFIFVPQVLCQLCAIMGKNAPIVTVRGNSCLLGVGFAGMLGLEEMR